jgi:GDP-mannose 6-dehydrogenase
LNVSIFGIGYVGCVSMACLAADGHFIIGVDTNQSKIDLINSGKASVVEKDLDAKIFEGVHNKKIIATNDYEYAVKNSDISIVCVGTPLDKNGKLDLSHVFKVAEQLGKALKSKKSFHVVSIRSSVLPGTISKVEEIISENSCKENKKDFAVLANPEFLREGSAVNDYYNPPYTLIGGDNMSAMEKLAEIYKNVNAEIIFTDIKNTELIKFVNNSFHALKVSFANEIGNICKDFDMDSHKFFELFNKDNKLNISSAYLKPGFAYGGSCLPKDLKALENLAEESKITAPVLSVVTKSNNIQIENAFQIIKKTGKKNIGFIGITFKEGTDDVRNSPYISLAKKLLDKKFSVKIFDSNLNLERVVGANRDYLFHELPVISDYLLQSAKEVIAESDLLVIANKSFITRDEILQNKKKIFLDLVRINESLITKDNYIGIAW